MDKYIDVTTIIHADLYDDEHEEYIVEEMTIEEYLDRFTEEGCPSTADVRENKHGKWIPNSPFTGNCSECGADGNLKDNFCSNCGADVRTKDEM